MNTQNKSTQNSYNWFVARPIMAGYIVFIILMLISAFVTFLSYQVEKKNNQRELSNIIKVIDQNIDQILDNSELAAFSLALTINDSGVPVDFEKVAEEILKSNSSIDAVQLVPQGIIKYIYPYEANKSALDYNILKDSTRNKEAFKAIQQRKIVFAGPFELRQGGLAIVGRLPIFIDNKFWGFSAVVIKLSTLFRNAGIANTENEGYKFQFSKINPDTKVREYFIKYDNNDLFSRAETSFIKVGEWTLQVAPSQHFRSLYGIFALAAFGLLFSIISALFVSNILREPAKLQQLVKEQSKELVLSGQHNNAILQALPDMLFIMSKDGVFLYHHNSAKMETLAPPEFFLNKNVTEIMPPLLAKEILANIKSCIEKNKSIVHNYVLKDAEENRHFEARYAKINENEALSVVRETTWQKKTEEEILHMNEELRRLSEYLQNVREEERASLSRELHDELGQQLTAISLDLHWIKKTEPVLSKKILHKIEDAITLVQESAATVKRINTELRPSILDDLGLFAALEWQVKEFNQRYDVKAHFNCEAEHYKISPSRSIAIFRIIQESLNNIAKHARATNINIHCFEESSNLKIVISDNGTGFYEKDISSKISFGLLGMKERANMLNGHVHIKSAPGEGTRVEVCIPLEHLDEEINFRKSSTVTSNDA
ncbi:MAG: hypothetical protein EYC69_00390 [Bacteroidetes bacterium]|nr:MAG: hypothetical protein EYC69_00390 [Bacteroidota bacterium]